MTRRARLLFVTPVTPADAGNGLAMRAGVWLEGLARSHDVRVLVAPVFGPAAPPGALVKRYASSFEVLELQTRRPMADVMARLATAEGRAEALALQERPLLARRATPAAARAVADAATGCSAVHVMRVYLAPLLDVVLGAATRPRLILDVDDLESEVERDSDRAGDEEQSRYRSLEFRYLPQVDSVSVAAPEDRHVLGLRHPEVSVVCIPNAVRMPRPADRIGTAPGTDTSADTGVEGQVQPSDLLLVGNLSYGPNVEGAEWFVGRVLSLLDVAPRVNLVGSSPGPRVRALARHPAVRIVGDVPAVTPWYAQARIALAPILRGGGTRIKVIEALAHGRPVVATRVGARGLDRGLIGEGNSDAPILVGDSPRAFAEGCARLLADPALARRLGQAGRAAVEATLSVEAVATSIDALVGRILAEA